jgi:hypothetical protein
MLLQRQKWTGGGDGTVQKKTTEQQESKADGNQGPILVRSSGYTECGSNAIVVIQPS